MTDRPQKLLRRHDFVVAGCAGVVAALMVGAAYAAGLQTIMIPDLVAPTPEITALCSAVMDSLVDVHRMALPPLAARA